MSSLERIELNEADLRSAVGLGVAGNFAGHLEQAGEAADFTNVVTHSPTMPKGIFPWYVPGSSTFLGQFPLSSTMLAVPQQDTPHPRIQIEPELALMCEATVDANGTVTALTPRWVAAFDDCSIRRPNAAKISEKKNWGPASKGLAQTALAVSDISIDGPTSTLRIASFLCRGDTTHAYGIDSEVRTYSLFGRQLLEWLMERLEHQDSSATTPLENVGAMVSAVAASHHSASPSSIPLIIGVGATRYEQYGQDTFVEPGDEAIVVVYNSTKHAPDDVAIAVSANREHTLEAASVLRRRAYDPSH